MKPLFSEAIETFEVTIKRDDNDKKLINQYRKIKTLGRGSFSKVIMVEDTTTEYKYAVKIIDKKALEKKRSFFMRDDNGNPIINSLLQDAMKEVAILKKMHHPNIIKLHEIMYDDDSGYIFLVLECCDYGPIINYDELSGEFSINKNFVNEEKRKFDYSEEELRDILRDIILGLDYLHAHHIIHRDIKPDNILVTFNKECKITDFNVSKILAGNQGDSVKKEVEGTMFFRAPECCDVESKEFAGRPLDIWALGVTTYILTYKELPFKPENPENIIELLDLISCGIVKFPDTRDVSDEFLNLMSKMLEKDPFKRITIKELKENPWINVNRVPLSNQDHNLIYVSQNEIEQTMKFFSTMDLIKKVSNIWKQKSLKKNLSKEIISK